MADDVKSIEKEAYKLLAEQKYQEASKLFCSAAGAYQEYGQHKQAALSFASAASCLEPKAAQGTSFYYAATFYEKAAKEAETSGDFEYASMLYKHAGICYERDLEFLGFSECFYLSRECYRKHLSPNLFRSKTSAGAPKTARKYNLKELAQRFASLVSLTSSSILWGHGERPGRTVMFGCFLILIFAFLYTQGPILQGGIYLKPNLPLSTYFSVLTFTHLGYGDIVPLGFNKGVAITEALIGIFIIPIFITGLCRKYLRFL